MIEAGIDYIFEGEEFLPELINELDEMYPDVIKRCFIGFADIDPKQKMKYTKKYAEVNDWLVTHMDDYVKDHIDNMIVYSKRIKEECIKHKNIYFDTSNNFMDTLKIIVEYLYNK